MTVLASAPAPTRRWTTYLRAPEAIGVLVMLVGTAFRLRQFLYNRSLWIDESMLGLNIVHRSARALLGPLDWNQAAPPGFLLAEKAAVTLFGNTDLALRVVPFASSLAALVMVWWLGRRLTTGAGAVVALALFSTCEKLIFFSSEVKQYSSDVMISLALLCCAEYWRAEPSRSRLLFFGVFGAAAVWLSHPAVFVLAGAAALLTRVQMARNQSRPWELLLAIVPWAVSFLVLYSLVLARTAHNDALAQFWRAYFMPFPPRSFDDLRWFLIFPFRVFEDPMSLQFPGLGAFCFIVGCIAYARSPGDRELLLLFLTPILGTLLASSLHQYPFGLRLLLFLIPIFTLVIAHGVALLLSATSWPVAAAAILLLLLRPSIESTYHLGKPREVQEIKALLDQVKPALTSADWIYVHQDAVPAFTFYDERYGWNHAKVTLEAKGAGGLEEFHEAASGFSRGDRCWLIFTHFEPGRDLPTIAAYQGILADRAELVSRIAVTGGLALLFRVNR
jgi:hypothetical protein